MVFFRTRTVSVGALMERHCNDIPFHFTTAVLMLWDVAILQIPW